MNPKITQLKTELSKAVIGQENMIEALIIGLLCARENLFDSIQTIKRFGQGKILFLFI